MWRVCRITALCQLRSQVARMPVTRARNQIGNMNWYFTSIAGVDRDLLLTRSARDLNDKLGESKIGSVAEALKGELACAIASEGVTSEEIIDLFTAAQKTRAVSVMLNAFDFLDTNYPSHINFAVYGEVFRILTRSRNSDRLIEIYKKSKPRFTAVPEMIYRFGIVGYLGNNDMDKAVTLWQEMTDAGHETTNEITSRLMMAYARHGDVERVQELYEGIDPQIGYWHESCIDRVILSMGIIKQPAKSFEFYSNSSMKLNGGTLIALLSVCSNNNCKKQASDILANRKKFDLRLDARGYNRIMMMLEFLERNNEIKDILEEMVEKDIRFDTRTRQIIERNTRFLKDTNFIVSPSKSRSAGYTLSPRIRELLAQGNFSEAVACVDSIVKSVDESQLPEDFEGEVPQGALIVSNNIAKDAVQAYIKAEQHDKVAALVKGISMVRGKYAYALAEVFTHYVELKTKTGDELSYAASKAMLFQGVRVYRVDDTLTLFRRFHDPDAALELFSQLLASYGGRGDRNGYGRAEDNNDEKPRYYHFNIGKAINLVLQTLVENSRLADALNVFDMMERQGLQATQYNYVRILSSMHKYLRSSNMDTMTKELDYDISDFQAVLKDLKNRDMRVNRAVLGYLCPAYKEADKQQRLELLEAFGEAQSDPNDDYILPIPCYNTLLKFMAKEGTMSDVRQLYDEAANCLDRRETLGVPRGYLTILIEKFAEDGNVDEAERLVMQMPEVCGGFTRLALVAVLRGALKAQKLEVVDSMVALMEGRQFIIPLSEAYELVHLAREQNHAQKALDIIRVFETGILQKVAPAADGSENLEEAYVHLQRTNAQALQKLKTIYSVTLKACEKDGLWKQALFLHDRMAALVEKEVVDEKALNLLDSPSKREENGSTDV